MPKRRDLDTIITIGAGPIVIGQACEFDYSGTQAIKALKDEGYRTVLLNSNPATIMTDPQLADATYIEPINPEYAYKVLEQERQKFPNARIALLPTMGGQTALNTSLTLANNGSLEQLNIEMIGAKADVINTAEDRELFRQAMAEINLECPKAHLIRNIDEIKNAFETIGLPAIFRPSFTLGGKGGGIAQTYEEFFDIAKQGLRESPVSSVLVEESVLGWKEFEMEVVRDCADNCIIVCSIENIDPMGTHTGDSVTVAPALTLSDREYQQMRNASIAVLRKIGVETGGSNVQFAINPDDGRMVVIEMNPRVSRSSALASKATGFPIAKIATRLAIGYRLDELMNDIIQTIPASFEPSIDYVATKIPRFTFEKFPDSPSYLSTSMKSVGEVMAIGRSFAESFQKALRSLEIDIDGLDELEEDRNLTRENLLEAISERTPEKIFLIGEALRKNIPIEDIYQACKIDHWFLNQFKSIIDMESVIIKNGLPKDSNRLQQIKAMGFSDKRLAKLTKTTPVQVVNLRKQYQIAPVFKRIDSCAGEFDSATNYFYSTYASSAFGISHCEAKPSNREKVAILGGGPNRIGQGIEFDYCCVHAAYALKECGYEAIMINCNPETVSTDYDTSDRLYFEPLCDEDVLEILKLEASQGSLLGVIVQFGGQTPLKLCHALQKEGIPILGTSPSAIDLAEDRKLFQQLLHQLKLTQPRNAIVTSREEAIKEAEKVQYPVVLRPSYVLGGRAMEIVHDVDGLKTYINQAVKASHDNPVLIDHYLRDAIEVDVDAIGDGDNIFIAAIMEHIEEAGIHSGDSACSLPPYRLDQKTISEISKQTAILGKALNVVGLMNIQFAVTKNKIYILEVNPRASRTVPFVAKAINIPIAKIATRVIVGEKLSDFNLNNTSDLIQKHTAIKEAVFPFNRFPESDSMLGPEMRSTGEVMGLSNSFNSAYLKAQHAANNHIPYDGTVFISVKDSDKKHILAAAKTLLDLGFNIMATNGTANFLQEHSISTTAINKVYQGSYHVVDAMLDNKIQLVFNTVEGKKSIQDSRSLRQTALAQSIAYFTTVNAIHAITSAISDAIQQKNIDVAPLQSYFN